MNLTLNKRTSRLSLLCLRFLSGVDRGFPSSIRQPLPPRGSTPAPANVALMRPLSRDGEPADGLWSGWRGESTPNVANHRLAAAAAAVEMDDADRSGDDDDAGEDSDDDDDDDDDDDATCITSSVTYTLWHQSRFENPIARTSVMSIRHRGLRDTACACDSFRSRFQF